MIPPESEAVIDNAAEFVDVECDIRRRRILDFKRCATVHFGPFTYLVAAAIPFLPLLLMVLPVQELIKGVWKMLF